MGRQIVWDGLGLPEVGDEVKFEVASTPVVQVGRVTQFEVERFDKTKHNSWRITVHMECRDGGAPYSMARLLEDIHPLTWTKPQ